MNLLFFDSVDEGTFGGYENWVVLTAKWLAARGHRAALAGRPGSEYLRRAKAACPEAAQLELRIKGDFDPRTILALRRYLEEHRIDLLTVNFNKDLRLGGLAARWQGRTRVCWRIGLDITSNGWAHRTLSPRLIDGVIVPSQALKSQVLRHGYLRDGQIRVIYNGTEDKRFERPDAEAARRLREKYNLPGDALVAVTSGRFVDQKGHRYLVAAAPAIVARHPSIRFLFLGNGEGERALRNDIDGLGLRQHFVFAGMLDNIEFELCAADVMIHPAIEEPFSHAILEGMRAGLPMVASRVGGIPEALVDGETALLVESRRPEQLAEAVNRLLDSPDQMRAFAEATQRRWRERFRIETMIDQVESYFGELTARGRVA